MAMKSSLSPKDLAHAIGVSESSLKRWVDQGLISAARTSGGHRRIPRSAGLAFVRRYGYPVLRPDLVGLDELAGVSPMAAEGRSPLETALIRGRAEEAQRLVVGRFVQGMPVATLIDVDLGPAMRSIGELWHHGEAGIFVEHRGVDICTHILDRLRDLLPPPDPGAPVALGGAPESDPYTLPTLMAATVLAAEGWRPVNLGAFVPEGALARAAHEEKPELVWLALGAAPDTPSLERQTRAWLDALEIAGVDCPLLAGGPACQILGRRPPGPARFGASMGEMADMVRGFRAP